MTQQESTRGELDVSRYNIDSSSGSVSGSEAKEPAWMEVLSRKNKEMKKKRLQEQEDRKLQREGEARVRRMKATNDFVNLNCYFFQKGQEGGRTQTQANDTL